MSNATIDAYLQDLDDALVGVPDAERHTIVSDMRAHADDAIADGRDPAAVIAAFGPPADVARQAREELGITALVGGVEPADRAGRLLHWSALALAVVTAVFVTFLLPSTAVSGLFDESVEQSVFIASSVFEELGLGVGLLPLVPATLALLPLVVPRRLRAITGWAAAGAVSVGAVIAGFSVGAFFVPLAMLLWCAVLVPLGIRRGNAVSARIWRVVGASVMSLPVAVAFGGLVTGTLEDPRPAFWITAVGFLLVAVAFALRIRFVDYVVAGIGAALMLLAIVDGGMLLIALWWGGAVWLVIGLSGVAGGIAAPRDNQGRTGSRDAPRSTTTAA